MNDIDQLDRFITDGRLIRGTWGTVNNRACLLVALAGDAVIDDPGACPAEIIPTWLAYLTPWIDDAGTRGRWPWVVREYARLVRASAHLTAEQWIRLDYVMRGIAVREAVSHTTDETAVAVCAAVVSLCDRRARGEIPSWDEWEAAAAEVGAAAAAWAEWAAEWAARAARAEEWAARAAAWAAAGAEAAAWAEAAREEAADRMIATFFAAWDAASGASDA